LASELGLVHSVRYRESFRMVSDRNVFKLSLDCR
jgi:hypothetical protein